MAVVYTFTLIHSRIHSADSPAVCSDCFTGKKDQSKYQCCCVGCRWAS